MKEPDFDKLADISARCEAASQRPDYSTDVFLRYLDEARAACGDFQQFTEFMARLDPDLNQPATAAAKKNALA